MTLKIKILSLFAWRRLDVLFVLPVFSDFKYVEIYIEIIYVH